MKNITLSLALLSLLASCASLTSSETPRTPATAATQVKQQAPIKIDCNKEPTGDIGSADDMSLALADKHAQLAHLIATARAKGMTCDVEAYQVNLLEQVALARKYNPKVQLSQTVDTAINNTLYHRVMKAFKTIDDYDISRKDYSTINWDGVIFQESMSGGIYGPKELRLRANGVLEQHGYNIDTGAEFYTVIGKWSYKFYAEKNYANGYTRDEGGVLYFQFNDSPKQKTKAYHIRYDSNGQIQLYKGERKTNAPQSSDHPVYTSFENSECDA